MHFSAAEHHYPSRKDAFQYWQNFGAKSKRIRVEGSVKGNRLSIPALFQTNEQNKQRNKGEVQPTENKNHSLQQTVNNPVADKPVQPNANEKQLYQQALLKPKAKVTEKTNNANVQTAPAKQPEPLTQPAPLKQSAPIQKPAPLEQPVPLQEPALIQKPAPLDQPVPLEKPAPLKQPAFIHKPSPLEQTVPLEQTAPLAKPEKTLKEAKQPPKTNDDLSTRRQEEDLPNNTINDQPSTSKIIPKVVRRSKYMIQVSSENVPKLEFVWNEDSYCEALKDIVKELCDLSGTSEELRAEPKNVEVKILNT